MDDDSCANDESEFIFYELMVFSDLEKNWISKLAQHDTSKYYIVSVSNLRTTVSYLLLRWLLTRQLLEICVASNN